MRKVVAFFEAAWFAPFLLAVGPIVQLYLLNFDEVAFTGTVRSLFASLLLALLVIGGLYLLLRDPIKSALVASLFLFLFFLFGDVSDWIAETFVLGPARANLIVFLLVALIILAWVWMIRGRIRNTSELNLYFNSLSILLLVNSGIQMRNHLLDNDLSFNPSKREVPIAEVNSPSPRPDIYYIVLDGYGRQDILQKFYEFDNSAFVSGLRERGFYVADASSSNYIQTMLSLSSSLNLNYVQNLTVDGGTPDNRADLIELLNYSEVRTVLANNGYQTISFENEYKATIPTADIYYADMDSWFTQPVTSFESIVIDHSMARVLTHISALNRALIEMPYERHRRKILSTFSRLEEVPAREGDFLVYAHIIAPHPPFVFDADGNAIPQGEPFTLFDANYYIKDHSRGGYIGGYRKQIQYINTLVLKAVDAILSRSATPPIIILQGDHGPGAYLHWGSLEQTIPSERFGILNAYYFPNQDYASLYPSISPVNSFRVVLNEFFAGDYALLPDLHYYSYWSFPFDFIEVTDLSVPQ